MGLSQATFLSIENARVKHLGKEIFQNLNFKMLQGQSWAILGNSGNEMTAFLDTLQGKSTILEGKITREFAEAYQKQKILNGQFHSFRDLISFVSQKYEFRNKSNIQDFYYQQRFNSSESEEAPTVKEFLNKAAQKNPGSWNIKNVLILLQLNALKDKSLIKLSNGETRRLAIAGALMKNPKLLLMDQPMIGLDIGTRKEFGKLVKAITDTGIQVMITSRAGEIPESISHVGILEYGRFIHTMKREDFHGVNLKGKSEYRDEFQKLAALTKENTLPEFEELITMRNVHIQYGDKVILDKINWKVNQGECWSLKGHNGAGKSTLLSLIFGENPQAYANDIVLFDKKRGTGESIWDIKKPTGFVSAEMPRYFPKSQNCLQVVLSGYFDTMGLFRKVNPAQEELAYKWLDVWNLKPIADYSLNQISLEEQRLCLLARAMIKSPSLLILDEATQGMDEEQVDLFRESIDWIGKYTRISMIYVSHYETDFPSCINRQIELKEGKILEIQ